MTAGSQHRRGCGVSLFAEFDMVDLTELRHEAAALARQLSAAEDDNAIHLGVDSSDTVCVSIDGGGAVCAVEVRPAWRATVGVEGLCAALVAATADAGHQRLRAWAERLAQVDYEAAGQPGEPDRPGPADWSAGQGQVDALAATTDPTEARGEFHHLFIDATDGLREVSRLVERAASIPIRGHEADGRMTVTVEHGQLSSVDFDRRWLRAASASTIAEAARVALQQAFTAAALAAAAPPHACPAITRLRALTADPVALLRSLGLG
jgi:DNA-binding protein YbaB